MKKQIIKCSRRGISWVAVMAAFQLIPLVIVDVDELANTTIAEDQIVYPDKDLGAYVIFQQGGAK